MNLIPGPGAYKLDSNHNSPSWSIKPSIKLQKPNNITPGPGTYNSADTLARISHPAHQMIGRAHMNTKDKIPGPGEYTPQDEYVKQRTSFNISFSSKLESNVSHMLVPGPGNYEVKRELKGKNGSKFGSSNRNALSHSYTNPGPGAYKDASLLTLKNHKFGKGSRKNMQLSAISPGPGQYNPNNCIRKNPPRCVIIGRPQTTEKKVNVPGPGSYYAQNLAYIPSHKLGKSERPSNKGDKYTPGPGQYKAVAEVGDSMKRKQPQWKMGTQTRDSSKNHLNKSVPGPGAYMIADILGNGPKVAIAPKSTLHFVPSTMPGPGAYTICKETSLHTKHVAMSKEKREIQKINNVPGPGSYYSNTKTVVPAHR